MLIWDNSVPCLLTVFFLSRSSELLSYVEIHNHKISYEFFGTLSVAYSKQSFEFIVLSEQKVRKTKALQWKQWFNFMKFEISVCTFFAFHDETFHTRWVHINELNMFESFLVHSYSNHVIIKLKHTLLFS